VWFGCGLGGLGWVWFGWGVGFGCGLGWAEWIGVVGWGCRWLVVKVHCSFPLSHTPTHPTTKHDGASRPHLDPPVVDEHVVHLEVRVLTRLFRVKPCGKPLTAIDREGVINIRPDLICSSTTLHLRNQAPASPNRVNQPTLNPAHPHPPTPPPNPHSPIKP